MRQPGELVELALGQRRPHRRDHRLETGLPQREHIRVSLDDDSPFLLGDRSAGPVEAVEQAAFTEELTLG